MLDAGLGAMKLLQLPESVRRSQEVQMGTGSFKSKAQMRSVAREWQKQAMGRQLAPQSAKGFLAQGLGMGIPASQTVITDPDNGKGVYRFGAGPAGTGSRIVEGGVMEVWIAYRLPWHLTIHLVRNWQKEKHVRAFIAQLEIMLEWRREGRP